MRFEFIGVTFDNPEWAAKAHIGSNVKIKRGARIELGPKLEIRGNTKIGANAQISGGQMRDCTIDGAVRGGSLEGCTVKKGGAVYGGLLENTTIRAGGRVKGGELTDSFVDNATVLRGALAWALPASDRIDVQPGFSILRSTSTTRSTASSARLR